MKGEFSDMMSTSGIAVSLFIVLGLVLVYVLHKRSKKGDNPWYTFTKEGISFGVMVEGKIPRGNAEIFFNRLVDVYSRAWPLIRDAFGLEDEYPRLDRIDVYKDGWETQAVLSAGSTDRKDVDVVGETIYAWPKYRIRLKYDPDGVGALVWELRNVARRMKYPSIDEWTPVPEDARFINAMASIGFNFTDNV